MVGFQVIQPLCEHTLAEARRLVHHGGVIAFPTETFYALGALPFHKDAVRRVFEIKGRSISASPLLVLIRDRADLDTLVAEMPPAGERLASHYWPGALTIVCRASDAVQPLLTVGTGTIGVRLSASPAVQTVLQSIGAPLTGTSANLTGSAPACTAEEVQAALGASVDLILDGGRTPGGLPSTVIDVTVDPPKLLREGVISRQSLTTVLGSIGLR
jgi:L-threonylcarbamoyladenylate synthase